MTPATVAVELLRKIPAKVRTGLLVAGVVAVAASWVLQLFEVPAPWEKIDQVIKAAWVYLGAQSLANVRNEDSTAWFDQEDYTHPEIQE